jgi:hypothetical protein
LREKVILFYIVVVVITAIKVVFFSAGDQTQGFDLYLSKEPWDILHVWEKQSYHILTEGNIEHTISVHAEVKMKWDFNVINIGINHTFVSISP